VWSPGPVAAYPACRLPFPEAFLLACRRRAGPLVHHPAAHRNSCQVRQGESVHHPAAHREARSVRQGGRHRTSCRDSQSLQRVACRWVYRRRRVCFPLAEGRPLTLPSCRLAFLPSETAYPEGNRLRRTVAAWHRADPSPDRDFRLAPSGRLREVEELMDGIHPDSANHFVGVRLVAVRPSPAERPFRPAYRQAETCRPLQA
jgi:hypothetical protein